MMRKCTEDVVLPGSQTRVPAGTEVVFCPASIAKMEKYFGPDVNEFKPERWQKDAHGKTTDMKSPDGTGKYDLNHTSRQYTFLPFEDGRRGCLGRHFAYREVMVLLTHFLLSFELLNERDFDPSCAWYAQARSDCAKHYRGNICMQA